MAAVNRNMFDACVGNEQPQGPSLLVLPLNLIAQIVACLDDPGDLARLCQTCRVLNYMTLPQLYRNLTLTSYDKIRYRGDEPEGMGSASPFTMGLNAVITRPYASLVRSLTLRGDWREPELEEHARVGRVPDSSMMLNIAVRAAVDRMQELEEFRWELSTKMLETVYLGLTRLPKLTSLTLRFPSSRHPRPTLVIPVMPHLRYLKITDIDPLCYPDDISTLLFGAKKLNELKMHWSPRMRNMQEPSVMVHDYFRKCISAKKPLTVKKFGMANLYARHSEDFNTAFDHCMVEEVTVLNETRSDGASLNTFVDNSWPVIPQQKPMHLKSMRVNIYNQRQSEFLGSFSGLERLYMVSTNDPSDNINSPRELAPSAITLTPPASDHTLSTSNDHITPVTADSPSNLPALQARARDTSLNSIVLNHAATLRHLLLPARWPLSSQIIARIVHASPQLEQLGFAAEISSMDTLGLLLPFLRNLKALRLLVPTRTCMIPGSEEPCTQHSKFSAHLGKDSGKPGAPKSFADFVELDDEVLMEKLSEALADQQVFRQLKIIGFGRKAFLLGDFHSTPTDHPQSTTGLQSQTPIASRAPSAEAHQYKSPQSYGESEAENGVATGPGSGPGPGLLSPTPNPTQTNSPRPPYTFHPKTSHVPQQHQQPPSMLGKRSRDDDSSIIASNRKMSHQTFEPCLLGAPGNRTLRRRLQRAGWDVLKHWEIWGLDTQEF
ncbi:hypothetical protein BDW59DRAFT_175362 [Aspergillus cavernicola]|uniref:F-box domain-containing protein n=1 Tax=Aspergillus cavernicola TaxID=176166 RepID=A0ABR4HQF7_9EURO